MNKAVLLLCICLIGLYSCVFPDNNRVEKEELSDPNWPEIVNITDSLGILSTKIVHLTDTAQLMQKYRISEEKIPEIAKKLAKDVKRYNQQPFYWIEIIRHGGNKVLLELNGVPFGNTFTNGSIQDKVISINENILKSGIQKLKIRVFTFSDQFINGEPKLEVVVGHTPDIRKRDAEPQYITKTVSLPDSVLNSNYWETELTFEANVPWDFSARLENAQDLRDIPNIENMILKKYEDLRQQLIDCDIASVYYDRLQNFIVTYTTNYITSYEDILNEIDDEEIKIAVKPNHPERKVYLIKNYELAFYKEGKIANLRCKLLKRGVLKTMRYNPYDYAHYRLADAWHNIILYMPKDSNELQIW